VHVPVIVKAGCTTVVDLESGYRDKAAAGRVIVGSMLLAGQHETFSRRRTLTRSLDCLAGRLNKKNENRAPCLIPISLCVTRVAHVHSASARESIFSEECIFVPLFFDLSKASVKKNVVDDLQTAG
jgi:hypothetical protein